LGPIPELVRPALTLPVLTLRKALETRGLGTCKLGVPYRADPFPVHRRGGLMN